MKPAPHRRHDRCANADDGSAQAPTTAVIFFGAGFGGYAEGLTPGGLKAGIHASGQSGIVTATCGPARCESVADGSTILQAALRSPAHRQACKRRAGNGATDKISRLRPRSWVSSVIM